LIRGRHILRMKAFISSTSKAITSRPTVKVSGIWLTMMTAIEIYFQKQYKYTFKCQL